MHIPVFEQKLLTLTRKHIHIGSQQKNTLANNKNLLMSLLNSYVPGERRPTFLGIKDDKKIITNLIHILTHQLTHSDFKVSKNGFSNGFLERVF